MFSKLNSFSLIYWESQPPTYSRVNLAGFEESVPDTLRNVNGINRMLHRQHRPPRAGSTSPAVQELRMLTHRGVGISHTAE